MHLTLARTFRRLLAYRAALLLPIVLVPACSATAQAPSSPPVAVELTAVTDYASVDLVLSKPLAPGSRWGVFHQHTLVAGYDRSHADDLATQSQVTFAATRWLRLTSGMFYASGPGFSPTAGLQLTGMGHGWFLSVSPRVNVERQPSYSVFTFVERTRGRLYVNLQSLNAFDAQQHFRSYQWVRAGVDFRGTKLGVGANLDEIGPSPSIDGSVGVFVRREVF